MRFRSSESGVHEILSQILFLLKKWHRFLKNSCVYTKEVWKEVSQMVVTLGRGWVFVAELTEARLWVTSRLRLALEFFPWACTVPRGSKPEGKHLTLVGSGEHLTLVGHCRELPTLEVYSFPCKKLPLAHPSQHRGRTAFLVAWNRWLCFPQENACLLPSRP